MIYRARRWIMRFDLSDNAGLSQAFGVLDRNVSGISAYETDLTA